MEDKNILSKDEVGLVCHIMKHLKILLIFKTLQHFSEFITYSLSSEDRPDGCFPKHNNRIVRQRVMFIERQTAKFHNNEQLLYFIKSFSSKHKHLLTYRSLHVSSGNIFPGANQELENLCIW